MLTFQLGNLATYTQLLQVRHLGDLNEDLGGALTISSGSSGALAAKRIC